MSAEDYRQSLKEQINQQYQTLREIDEKINTETSPIERAKAEREKKQIQGNIKRIEQELSDFIAAPPTEFFRYLGFNSAIAETALIGRETELKNLDQLLANGGCAAIIGVGGQGKTALAYKFLVQSSKFKVQSSKFKVQSYQSDENSPSPQIHPSPSSIVNRQSSIVNPFEAAVWLRVQGDGTDLGKLLGLVGLKAANRPDDSAELLRQYLAQHPVLVVLDNFEDAIKEDGTLPLDIEALLPRLIGLRGPSRVLITSREVPKPKAVTAAKLKVLHLSGLSQQAGADLLVELGLESEPRASLEEAARKAGGNPFALTLLAGLVTDSNNPEDTLGNLLREGDLWDRELATEQYFLPRTWNARLNEEEHRLLQLTAILRPPTRYQTLLDLFQPSDEVHFRALLNRLAAKALLSAERDSADPKKIRGYDLHPLFRRFSLTQKLTQDEQTALHQAATIYFQSLIPTLPPKENYGRKSVNDVWCILEAVHHLSQQGNYEAAADLFFAEELHEGVSRWGLVSVIIEIFSRWANITSWRSPSLRGIILGTLGNAYKVLGQIEQAISYINQALAIARKIGDRRSEGASLGNLGNAYRYLGQVGQAISYYQQALAISKMINNKLNEGKHLGSLGNAYSDLGQVEQAISYYQQALAIAREIGDSYSESVNLSNLANVYKDLGQVEQAISYYQQALTIAIEIGDKEGESATMGNLGIVYKDLGQVDQAIFYYVQALIISREIHHKLMEGQRLGDLGVAFYQLGKVKEAMGYYQQHLVIAKEIGDKRGEGIAMGNLGIAYKDLGQVDQAISHHQQALAISREISDIRSEGNHLSNLGIAYAKQEQMSRTLAHWRRAVEIFSKIKSPLTKTMQGLIDELHEKVGEEEFARLWAESEPIYQELRKDESVD